MSVKTIINAWLSGCYSSCRVQQARYGVDSSAKGRGSPFYLDDYGLQVMNLHNMPVDRFLPSGFAHSLTDWSTSFAHYLSIHERAAADWLTVSGI